MVNSLKSADVLATPGSAAQIGTYDGYDSPLQAAGAGIARTAALLAAIGHLSELIEEADSGDAFLLATAIQACVESATSVNDMASRAVQEGAEGQVCFPIGQLGVQ